MLGGRQVPLADAEDIVQEVAARALVHPEPFATRDDLARWCWRVGWRLRIDASRKAQRLSGDPCPEVLAADDTARLVEGRLALEEALSGMTALAPVDRQALFATAPPDASRQDTVRLAVRRHRARARLRRAIGGGLAGVLAWLDALRQRLRAPTVALATSVVVMISLGVGTLVTPAPVAPVPTPQSAQEATTALAHDQAPSPAPPTAASMAPERMPRAVPPAPSTPPTSATLAAVPVGPSATLRVSTEEKQDPPTACVRNVLGIEALCLDRPGPDLPLPPLTP